MSGLRGIPPLVDLVATAAVSSVRVNGVREFYDPWLVDYHGERGSYFGQMLNDGGSGIPGSGALNDPNWFAQADPRWSPDGTKIVVRQELILPPACGVTNQPPCPDSTEPGGERARILFFNLTSRQPTAPPTQPPGPELVPWGIPYVPDTIRARKHIPGGSYILEAGELSMSWATCPISAVPTGRWSLPSMGSRTTNLRIIARLNTTDYLLVYRK